MKEKTKELYDRIQNKLGLIFHNKGETQKAADYFASAIRENPRYTEAYLNLIITYNDMGETDTASGVYDRMMQVTRLVSNENVLEPFAAGKLANEHFRLGKIYMDFGQTFIPNWESPSGKRNISTRRPLN
jgi:tetratricopeptide (TPR) repeat protein